MEDIHKSDFFHSSDQSVRDQDSIAVDKEINIFIMDWVIICYFPEVNKGKFWVFKLIAIHEIIQLVISLWLLVVEQVIEYILSHTIYENKQNTFQ